VKLLDELSSSSSLLPLQISFGWAHLLPLFRAEPVRVGFFFDPLPKETSHVSLATTLLRYLLNLSHVKK